MSYLLEYVLHRTKTDAPEFLKYIMKSFLIKILVLSIFLPLDLLYIIINFSRFRNELDFIVFSEKYKMIRKKLNGTVGVITYPTIELVLNKNLNILYIPASIYFILTFISILSNHLIKLPFFQLKTAILVLHTDALMVPRYLLKALKYKHSVCIQHGEFSYLNEIYDGKLCSHNIVMGPDQAKLFESKSYPGELSVYENLRKPTVDPKVHSVVLVGRGLHINDALEHRSYQKKLKELYINLRCEGINVYYRPHPSENFWNYWYFFGKTEKNLSKNEFNLGSLYVGLESTLLRQVCENGGHAKLLSEINFTEWVNILNSNQIKNLKSLKIDLNARFVEFATKVINDIN